MHHERKDADGKKSDSTVRRQYLDAGVSRLLKQALSLACQQRWREKPVAALTTAGSMRIGKEGDRVVDEELLTWGAVGAYACSLGWRCLDRHIAECGTINTNDGQGRQG